MDITFHYFDVSFNMKYLTRMTQKPLFTLGKIYKYLDDTSNAIHNCLCIHGAYINNTIIISNIAINYNASLRLIHYYPKGQFQCSYCKEFKEMNATNNIYFRNYYKDCVYGASMICKECKDKLRKENHLLNFYTKFLFSNYDSIGTLRKQSKERYELTKEQRAINKLKPYILHWAYKYNGPCYRVLKRKYT